MDPASGMKRDDGAHQFGEQERVMAQCVVSRIVANGEAGQSEVVLRARCREPSEALDGESAGGLGGVAAGEVHWQSVAAGGDAMLGVRVAAVGACMLGGVAPIGG